MYDIATHPATGDWLFSSNVDYQVVRGEQVVAQRIRNRLRIVRGTWILDPSDGSLGSRLETVTHIPRGRAIREIPLMIEEALAPMDDIEIVSVETEEGDRSVSVTLEYAIVEPGLVVSAEDRLRETLKLELPA